GKEMFGLTDIKESPIEIARAIEKGSGALFDRVKSRVRQLEADEHADIPFERVASLRAEVRRRREENDNCYYDETCQTRDFVAGSIDLLDWIGRKLDELLHPITTTCN